jgi:2-dehydro-3-deoxyphosphooctonate aldolase (KDO 8-P synthase)
MSENEPRPRPRTPSSVRAGERTLGGGEPFLIAGPCVLERPELTDAIVSRLVEITEARGVTLVFKASFDKANRSSGSSTRGPGIEQGLAWLADVKARHGVPVLTDVHLPEQCTAAAEVVDVLQIPAFLCRQTDLLVAACETGRAVNVKKGQFLAPWDMQNVVDKCRAAGNANVLVTERGTSFGYGRLVVDMTGLAHLAATGAPVVFDATHSVQEPGALGERTGGDRTKVPALARAAAATGNVDGFFFEVHPDPDRSPSDGPNMVRLDEFPGVLDGVLAVWRAVRGRDAG